MSTCSLPVLNVNKKINYFAYAVEKKLMLFLFSIAGSILPSLSLFLRKYLMYTYCIYYKRLKYTVAAKCYKAAQIQHLTDIHCADEVKGCPLPSHAVPTDRSTYHHYQKPKSDVKHFNFLEYKSKQKT